MSKFKLVQPQQFFQGPMEKKSFLILKNFVCFFCISRCTCNIDLEALVSNPGGGLGAQDVQMRMSAGSSISRPWYTQQWVWE